MKYLIILAVALGLILSGTSSYALSPTPLSAGDPIYMKFPNIDGDVTAQGHEKWIELNSFQWGVGRSISSPTGGSAGREASAPSVGEIIVTKSMDKSSAKLLQEALVGNPAGPVVIDLVKNGFNGSPFVYGKYTLENVLVSGYSVSSGGDNPSESISLNFAKITFSFFDQTPTGGIGSPIEACYDIVTRAAC